MSRTLKRKITKLGNSKEAEVLEKMENWHNVVSLGGLVTLLEANMADHIFCDVFKQEPRRTIAWLIGATGFPIIEAKPLPPTEE